MNIFKIHKTVGNFKNTMNFFLVEVKPHAVGFTRLKHKPNEDMLVLKQWRGKYMGIKKTTGGRVAEREICEIKEALEKGGFESARSLYVTGVFNLPHDKIMSILKQ